MSEEITNKNLTDAQDSDIIVCADVCQKRRDSSMLKARLSIQKGRYYAVLDRTVNGKRQRKTIGLGFEGSTKNFHKATEKMKRIKEEWEAKEQQTGHIIGFNDQVKQEREEERQRFMEVETPSNIASMRFEEYLVFWLKNKETTIQQSTFNSYYISIHSIIYPYFSQKKLKLKDVTPYHLEEFYACEMRDRGICAETIRRYHAIIRSALADAERKDVIPNNPASKVSLPRKEKFYSTVLEEEQVQLLISKIHDTIWNVPIVLSLSTGMRRGEVIGLRWEDIDFENSLIHIRGTMHSNIKTDKTKDGLTWIPQAKTASSLRDIGMDQWLSDFLRREKNRQIEASQQKGYNKEWMDYVCVRPVRPNMGKIIPPGYITTSFNKILEECGIDRIRWHDLRGTVATLLHDRDIDIKNVSYLLGHSDIQTTANFYAKIKPKSTVKMTATMTNIINATYQGEIMNDDLADQTPKIT